MVPWERLTAALDELDAIRAQLRESRGLERTARFYSLVRVKQIGTEHSGHVASVIELSHGWCIIHWTHDPKSVALYSTILSARKALCADGVLMLMLEDASERTVHESSRRSNTRGRPLTHVERLVLIELGHGLSNGEIATRIGRAPNTVKNVLSDVFRKLGVQDRLQAALLARDLDLTGPSSVSPVP